MARKIGNTTRSVIGGAACGSDVKGIPNFAIAILRVSVIPLVTGIDFPAQLTVVVVSVIKPGVPRLRGI